MAATTAFRDVAPRPFLASLATVFAFVASVIAETVRLRAEMTKGHVIQE